MLSNPTLLGTWALSFFRHKSQVYMTEEGWLASKEYGLKYDCYINI